MCKQDEESIGHLFLHCSVAQDAWQALTGFCNDATSCRQSSGNPKQLLQNWPSRPGVTVQAKMWALLPYAVLWAVVPWAK
ncbi:hypothetical protein FRX31_010967 [Thalictrum thalictroides]|uniref:Reverse transcriptase zinc-binding domain-containing protein n=1 Tax=Thalictrum thalictroides TaxID=46969 RepID=A0A7J6WR77_THATH|nr:hypothetical protein FRX31_010967 [Thalictrum thalictroides]